MKPPAIRLVCFAWGEAYVDRLLDFCLASVLAPGNLPALAKSFDCTVVVLTEKRLFGRVLTHPVANVIETMATLRLLALDDLITEPWQYGMTLTYALFRGVLDLGPAMTETYSLFLNADFVLADGCYERLIPRISAGERVHLAPSYCAVEEQVRPLLEQKAAANGGIIAIPPRDLAAMILSHRHNTVRAKTVNQEAIHFAHTDQFYWTVDEYTLLGHQMPISLIGMRAEQTLAGVEAFWDWGVVYDFCPSKSLTALGDSDDFLMLEMRREAEHTDLVRLGKATAAELAAGMSSYITQYQLDNAQFQLTLHSASLRSDLDEARAHLRQFVAMVFAELSPNPISHRRHPQWIYHVYHFERTRRIRQRVEEIRSKITSIEGAAGQANAGACRLGTEDERSFRQLRSPLEDVERLHELDQPIMEAFRAFLLRETGNALATSGPNRRRIENVLGWLFGTFPHYRPWSPHALASKPIREDLRQLQRSRAGNVLAICRDESELTRSLAMMPGVHAHASAAAVFALGLDQVAPQVPLFDICIIEAQDEEFPYLSRIFDRLIERLRPGGELRLYWVNRFLVSTETWQAVLKTPALLGGISDLNVAFFSARMAAASMKIINVAPLRGRTIPRRALVLAAAVPTAMVLALMAHLFGLQRASSVHELVGPCLAVSLTSRKQEEARDSA